MQLAIIMSALNRILNIEIFNNEVKRSAFFVFWFITASFLEKNRGVNRDDNE
ncbi:hypothetical protein [Paenibacillus sp. BJ-4]|uniref:hypothetical protein n=1 Tax=Paenibacillus sp. BJ-4 TaxID=2878097 RepID=UPI001CF09DB1|nr:hypothetical protein [Paenibacillus sp. BJ-4]